MSLFRKAGEKFEETKQAFVSGKEPTYVCRACEERVTRDDERCPHCGEGPIERVE